MLSVYEAEKTVLSNGKYDLTEELKKIDVFLASNTITLDQREELVQLANDNASVDGSLPAAIERLSALEKRVRVVELKTQSMPAPEAEWPEWKKPESSDQFTAYGEGVTYAGNHYLFVNKQKPARAGFDPTVYPKSWYLVTDMSKTVEQAFADYEESLKVEEKPQTDVPSSAPAEEDQNTSTDTM